MQVIWSGPEGVNSRTVWLKVNESLGGDTISRVSIINFLEAMREMGVLDAEDLTGKDGHQYVYKMGMSEEQFKLYVAKTLIKNLLWDFPE